MIERSLVKPINIATIAMGQGIAVTPIQLASAVAAVANEGTLFRPQIVRQVKDKNGQIVRDFQPDIVNQVLESTTAHQLKGVLESVVEKGTGRNAFVEGFRIGGKTGTAQKVGAGGYMPGQYVASFVGFAPADNPEIVMLVVIDEPVGIYYGGQIAAPVFGAVMKDVLPYLKVAPQHTTKITEDNNQAHVVIPNLINLPVAEATKELQKAGLNARVEEAGERVTGQIPKPGSRLPKLGSVLLYTLTPRFSADEVTVPDLRGTSLAEAANILAEIGLVINPVRVGGNVVSQDPLPGGKVHPGTTISISCE
jgi:stage V sporulation protein D (sporulation-specific penicillin-binding protein)